MRIRRVFFLDEVEHFQGWCGRVDLQQTLRDLAVLLATPISGLPGVYQVRVTAPDFIATDRLYLICGNLQSNIVDVPIRAGSNTTNVTGTIDGLYPSSDPYFTLPPCTTDDPNAARCAPGVKVWEWEARNDTGPLAHGSGNTEPH